MALIAIDVTSSLASQTGIGVCVRELVGALLTGPDAPQDEFRLCAVSARKDAEASLRGAFPAPNLEIRVRRIPVRLLRRMTDLSPLPAVEDLFGGADIFHASHLLVPASRRTATVVTVYDLTPIRFPEYHIASNRFTLEQLRRWLERVDLVIVNSYCASRDLQDLAAVAEDKLRVIPLGVKKCFRPLEEDQRQFLAPLGLDCDYILTVGQREPRKNLIRLLRAFQLLRERHRVPHKLAVVGPSGWMEGEIHRSICDLELSSSVVFGGFVDEQTLNRLYNGAALTVYPSLYEGFGLPPLEAMAAGCPVAVSSSSSMPEVVGDAGLYFDPASVDEMCEVIHQILDSHDLRVKLAELGLRRSRAYSWTKAANATRRVYWEAQQLRGKHSTGDYDTV